MPDTDTSTSHQDVDEPAAVKVNMDSPMPASEQQTSKLKSLHHEAVVVTDATIPLLSSTVSSLPTVQSPPTTIAPTTTTTTGAGSAVSSMWSVLEQHHQLSATATTTTIRDTYLGAYEALIEIAFLANDDASSPQSLKEVYIRSLGCMDYTTAIPMPSFPSSSSLPKMGDYLTALQNLIDTIQQQSPSSSSCGSGGGIDSSPVLMVSTFMAALGAVTELAERYDDEPSSDHYACMKDALSTQEHILLDAATVAKQQHQGLSLIHI
eukprot:TRINITY_DN38545_c0_g1_i1.p1 TRINITY_DN38545_c0_g1~~TRINITY_DN38545_c0_g1_i1.p1  ORF type:complete len:265 (+),score=57.60 TRINITY_DN38545_c0_g1_i1:237-1031(+)